jgi:signal transduction histidine kinase
MSYLETAQYMAAAAFFSVALSHLFVWVRVRAEIIHLLFALTATAAGANAIAEELMYRADSIDVMGTALRLYVATSGLWAIATVCFVAAYTRVGRIGRSLTVLIVVVFGGSLAMNMFSSTSFLYTEITGLREISLPWGEQIYLAIGEDNPLRFTTELALLAVLAVVVIGCNRLWLRQQRIRAVLFGTVLIAFFACFGTHAFLVDTGRLDSPYLSTYGFLALAGLMSYELAGEVLRRSELSSELQDKEQELATAVEDERGRIAGDLHDSVTQTLFSTAAIADALPEVWERHPNEAMRGLEDLRQLTKGALAEMRTLLWEMRPEALLERELGSLLHQLADASASRSRVAVGVIIEGDRCFPEDVQVAMYRIAQEALHNISKHAKATQASLQLR